MLGFSAKLDRQYRFIFLSILGLTLVAAMAMVYFRYQDVKNENFQNLRYANELVHTSLHAMLAHQESTMSFLGRQLVNGYENNLGMTAQRFLQDEASKNPYSFGFRVYRPNGGIALDTLHPELLSHHDDFKQPEKLLALVKDTDDMQMGKTFFSAQLASWITPLSIKLKTSDGEPFGVLVSAFTINNASRPMLAGQKAFPMELSVIRQVGSQYYRQFVFKGNDAVLKRVASSAVPQEIVDKFTHQVRTNLKLEGDGSFDASGRIGFGEFENMHGKNMLFSVQYDEQFKLYTVLTHPKRSLCPPMKPHFFWIAGLSILFNVLFYVLLKVIADLNNRSKAELEYQTSHDALTQLPNRTALSKLTDVWLTEPNNAFTLLLIDLNNFKAVNDTFGHHIGDAVLRSVTSTLHDVFPHQPCFRLSADEFVVILQQHSLVDIERSSNSLLRQLELPRIIQDIELSIEGRIGVSQFPSHGDDLSELIRKADIAVYHAKERHLSMVVFNGDLDAAFQRTTNIKLALKTAIERDEFYMVYQPQLDAKTGDVLGVEALIRWEHPEMGNVPPTEFIPIAEQAGFINLLGRFVLYRSMKDTQQLIKTLGNEKTRLKDRPFRLSVNVSVKQLLHRDFTSQMLEVLSLLGDGPIRVMLEVTESLFIDDLETATAKLKEMNEAGFLISLDDFGTGYSSLQNLSQLPLDELKIDRAFVKNISNDRKAQSLIQNIISIGNNLALDIVAEGVEDENEARLLKSYGCDIFQGYHFSKPLPKDELRAYLLNVPVS